MVREATIALIRIAPEDVQLGMFIQGFDGSWLDHPFWRTRFVIETERDLLKVRESAVSAVIIDDALGSAAQLEPVTASPEASSWQPPARHAAPAWRPAPAVHTPQPQSFPAAYGRATRIFGKSRKAVSAMYSDVRLGKAIKAEKLVPLVDEITSSIDENPRAFISIAQLKTRHEYTYMHSVAVCALMINLARDLRFSDAAVRDAGMAGLLHDIGKALMPLELLDKPGKLTDEEFEVIKTHPMRGQELLKQSSGVSHNALEVCLRHHERFDGQGYPDGLSGDRLSLFARMGALCDVYDAVTSERAYKPAWSPTETVANMRDWAGHFDPEMFELFVKSVGIYPTGALVRLKSGRVAMVTGENPDDPTRPPLVSVPDALHPEAERLDPAVEEIVGMESAEALHLESWESKRAQMIKRFRS
ncbi:HD-GYP domain-containing protein [Sphingomonas tabacisoli]|uniref:HD-GYP domain-containing protein n=1 Tax=Sphingomonas tabacisoli TaxID=2249466 RepID=A0ABW4I2A7_9SPHN